MGSKLYKFDLIPRENEQLEAHITVPEEPRSVIHGIVKDCKGKLVEDAVVKLFTVEDCHDPYMLKPMTHTFTDECGQFLFGPLCPDKKYVIKVWFDNVKKRKLKLPPDDCHDVCITLGEEEV